MIVKTSLNLKLSQSKLLYEVASRFNVSLSFIINTLARKIFKSHSFSVRFLHTVQYQDRLHEDYDCWKPVHVSFQGDVFEKCQDMRKVFKVSVSLVFSIAIKKYLDELIQELEGVKDSDNYTANYIFLYFDSGYLKQITLLWDMIEPEKLRKLQELHRST